MKDLINVKFFLKKNISWCAADNFSNSSKNNSVKTFFILPKNECTRKAWIARTKWKSMDKTNLELSAVFNFIN